MANPEQAGNRRGVTGAAQHLAHFSWATLRGDTGSPEVAEFENAVPRVNALAERSAGFVWRDGEESDHAAEIGWSLFTENPRLIASFSVWESPEHLKHYIYNTIHGAFWRRREEWFDPPGGANYVLWWVPAGHVPTMEEARDRVELYLANGPSDQVFSFADLEAGP